MKANLLEYRCSRNGKKHSHSVLRSREVLFGDMHPEDHKVKVRFCVRHRLLNLHYESGFRDWARQRERGETLIPDTYHHLGVYTCNAQGVKPGWYFLRSTQADIFRPDLFVLPYYNTPGSCLSVGIGLHRVQLTLKPLPHDLGVAYRGSSLVCCTV